jgi:hypothetical protein
MVDSDIIRVDGDAPRAAAIDSRLGWATTRPVTFAGRDLKSWILPLTLAAAVGFVLYLTPSLRVVDTTFEVVDKTPGLLAGLAAVAAVALSRHRLGLATGLAVVPWLSYPLTGTLAWGWWLAGLVVLAVAVYDGAGLRALPIGLITVALAVGYATTQAYWAVPLVGPVNLPGPSYLLAYLGVMATVVVAARTAGWAVRRRLERTAVRPPDPVTAIDDVAADEPAIDGDKPPAGG